MASLFKPTVTETRPDGTKRRRTVRKWYAKYRDADGQIRKPPLARDKGVAQSMLAEIVRKVERQKAGLESPFEHHLNRPLNEHLSDFISFLRDKDNTEAYVKLTKNRILAVLEAGGFEKPGDILAEKVQRYLAERRRGGLSIESSNHYLRRFKEFCRWMFVHQRTPINPVAALSLANANTDRRHDRRRLEADELQRLIEAAYRSSRRCKMSGPDRAMLYRLTVETGFRAKELRTLTPEVFDLDTDQPTITIRAAYSKHSREDVQPIRRGLADDLRKYLTGKPKGKPAFDMPTRTAEMLRGDLKAAGIPYVDDAGRVCDFHALRHTFISNLAAGGIHPKIAQQLARHSTITLTMDRYTHTVVGELAAALDVLPDLSQRSHQKAVVGFDNSDTGAQGVSPNVSPALVKTGQSGTPRVKNRNCEKKRSTAISTGKPSACGVQGGPRSSGSVRTPGGSRGLQSR